MPLRTFACALLCATCLSPAVAGLPGGIDDAGIRAAAAASFPEYFELLYLPNDSRVAADIQKNAAWLEHAFQQRGFVTRQFDNHGRPLVFAEYGAPDPSRKT